MKIDDKGLPRTFCVGANGEIEITHSADIFLEHDEQITIKTDSGTEFDIVRKGFGYYATPSLNNRLVNFHLKAAIVRGRRSGRAYILMCEVGKEEEMQSYCDWDDLRIVCWISSDSDLDKIESTFPESEYSRTSGISKYSIHEPSQSLLWLHKIIAANWVAKQIVQNTIDDLPDQPSLLMADCGDGEFLQKISASLPNWQCTGSTPYEGQVLELHEKAPHIKTDIQQLLNVHGKFDAVLSLEGLPRAREIQPILEKLTSLLKPNGVLSIMGFVNDEDIELYTEMKVPDGRWKTGYNCISRSGITKYFDTISMNVDFQLIPIPEAFLKTINSSDELQVVYDRDQNPMLSTKSGVILNPILMTAKRVRPVNHTVVALSSSSTS